MLLGIWIRPFPKSRCSSFELHFEKTRLSLQNRHPSTLKSAGRADVRALKIGLPISARPGTETAPSVERRIFHVARAAENSLAHVRENPPRESAFRVASLGDCGDGLSN